MENETNQTPSPYPSQTLPGEIKQRAAGMPKLPRLAGVLCAVLMVLGLFLPLFSASEDLAEYFHALSEDYVEETLGLSADQLEEISPLEYGKLYSTFYEDEYDGAASALYIGLTAVLAAGAVLTLLLAACNKPLGALFFDIAACAAFQLAVYDLTDRGIVPSDNWSWGAGYYLLQAAPVLMAVLAVWMLVSKVRAKSAAKGL